MAKHAEKFHDRDNVARAYVELDPGVVQVVTPQGETAVTLVEKIRAKFKFATEAVEQGGILLLLGEPIGIAKCDIKVGELVHVRNVSPLPTADVLGDATQVFKLRDDLPSSPEPGSALSMNDLVRLTFADAQQEVCVDGWTKPPTDWQPSPLPERQTFLGYERPFRPDGRVGTENWILIVPMVGCISSDVEHWVEQLNREIRSRFRNVSGVMCLSHRFGCSQTPDGASFIQRQVAALPGNPNVGAVVFNGMKCENLQFDLIKDQVTLVFPYERWHHFLANLVDDEFGHLRQVVLQLAQRMEAEDRRTEQSVDKLVVSVECGGSDGMSFLVNSVFGRVVQYVCTLGGTAIISELEELSPGWILRWARSQEVARDCLAAILHDSRNLTLHEGSKNTNPTFGNEQEGITTIDEKQLGASAKAIGVPIFGALDYGEVPQDAGGVYIGRTTANDPRSITAKIGMAANLSLFSTGNGSWWYPGLVPQLMCSSNTPLATQKPHLIDFDGGRLVSTDVPLDHLALELFATVLEAASGSFIPSGKLRGNGSLHLTNTGAFV